MMMYPSLILLWNNYLAKKHCLKRVSNLHDSESLHLDLKFADIKLLVLYKEWVLLKEFEKFDNALADKLRCKQNEKTDIEEKVIVIG